ncbi:MAG TPA: hypothetical protein VFI02_15590 [Armatimonadota bacterium]|nr:hypothetical protein [Armatimonadota bacterium]
MRRIVVFSLIALTLSSLCAFAADKPSDAVANPWKQHVDMEFKNAPLPEAISAIFKGTDINYTVSSELNQARVTAKLSNLLRGDALQQVVTAAGAWVKSGENLFAILPTAPNSYGAAGGGGGGRARPGNATDLPKDAEVQIFNLRYVDAGHIIPLIASDSQVQLIQSSEKSILAKGGKEALRRLAGTIIMLDTPSALPRAVKIQLRAGINIGTGGAKPTPASSFTTLSIGAEGTAQPLSIKVGEDPAAKQPRDLNMDVSLTPTITPVPADASPGGEAISLVGSGSISGHVPEQFSKPFDVAVLVAPGKEQVIAAGSMQFGDTSVEFIVTALATIEGRVKLPAFPKQSSGKDETDLKIELINAESALEEAKIAFMAARSDLEDVLQRYNSKLCPQSDVRAAEMRLELAQVRLVAAEKTCQALEDKYGGR